MIHDMMCCVMNKVAVDLLKQRAHKFEHPIYDDDDGVHHISMHKLGTLKLKALYYCPY
jgi:hypothetical protein